MNKSQIVVVTCILAFLITLLTPLIVMNQYPKNCETSSSRLPDNGIYVNVGRIKNFTRAIWNVTITDAETGEILVEWSGSHGSDD